MLVVGTGLRIVMRVEDTAMTAVRVLAIVIAAIVVIIVSIDTYRSLIFSSLPHSAPIIASTVPLPPSAKFAIIPTPTFHSDTIAILLTTSATSHARRLLTRTILPRSSRMQESLITFAQPAT